MTLSGSPVRLLVAVLLTLVLAPSLGAQTVIAGRVSDARTGEGLAAATVQVVGTARGTITNRAGDYELEVPEGADSLRVRYIGYEPAVRAVTGARVDLALEPDVSQLAEAVVTASVTADEIMRRVIARKAHWQAGLRTWRAQAYSRQTIRASGRIVAVIEGQTTAYWDRDRGLREIVKGSRQTGNLGALPVDAFTAADQTVNFYDDDIEFGGYTLMGPTHPRATSFYAFAIEGTRSLGDQRVYDLSFRPRNPLQPGLDGTLAVLAGPDVLVSLSTQFSRSVQFPLVDRFEMTLEQQFSPFGLSVDGREVWLPADYRIDGRGRPGNALLQFPDIGFAISSRFTDYAVNVAVPDSLYESDATAVDSVALARGLAPAGVVPLSADEERALAEIDSTQSLTEALRPSGVLARFFNVSTSAEASGTAEVPGRFRYSADPVVAYNRVEGVRLGADVAVSRGPLGATLDAAYLTAADRVSVRGAVAARMGSVQIGLGARSETTEMAGSDHVTPLLNSISALLYGHDYFDYAQRGGVDGWVRWRRGGARRPVARFGVTLDDYDPAVVATRYALLGRALPPDNVRADGRSVGAATLSLQVGSLGRGLPASVAGHRGAEVRAEVGTLVGGAQPVGEPPQADDGYRSIEGDLRWYVPTVLRRRLLPPTLHLRLAAGLATESAPVQRVFGIDGQHAGLAPFGALRSRTGRLTLAQRYALAAWEHDFRSVPFEILGWRGAAPRGVSLMVHGAHAWADGAAGAATEPSVVHHEIGVSLGVGYTVPVRLDATYRLTDTPGVVVGFGLTRLL